MIRYSDLDPKKEAFIFELDDVLLPEKDYWFQVYYLFTALLEHHGIADARQSTSHLIEAYVAEGKDAAFENLKKRLNLDEKYREGFLQLSKTAKLPLKLLLYQHMLNLLQDIVIDRKKVFIVTNGVPEVQLNKIKQTEWNGLESYLTCYFANELAPKPETDAIDLLIKNQNLQRRNVLMIGITADDASCAEASGIDFVMPAEF